MGAKKALIPPFTAEKENPMTLNSDTSASDTIDSYRKRQQRGPIIIWGIVALLVVTGLIILLVAFTGDNKPQISLFSTETPTPTLTSTATLTSTPTSTPSPTLTATITLTPIPPTASAPFSYVVQENESLVVIAEKFGLEDNGILLLLALNPVVETRGYVLVGEEIIVPNPDMKLPTATAVPIKLRKGTELEYTIRPGDSIAAIAAKFRSTEDAILELNEIENANSIQAGQVILIPVNLVTPAPTRLPPTAPADATATPVLSLSGETETPIPPALTCDYQENTGYIAQIFELVNNERVTQGLSPVAENPQLTAAALVHASDMACNSFLDAQGSNGSTPEERVITQEYIASLLLQEIHVQLPEYGGDGQGAFYAWMNDSEARKTLRNPNITEIGIAYAYSEGSALGGYFTIILAAP